MEFSLSNKNKKTLSVKQSNRLLASFRSLIRVGNSLPASIDVLVQVESGNNKKLLERINHAVTHQNFSIGKAFEREGVIKTNEVFLIDRSTSASVAIDSILAVRELQGSFEKTFLKLFAFPMIAFVIGLIIAYVAQPTFYNIVDSLVQQVQVAKGIVVEDRGLVWYLENRSITRNILMFYLLFLVGMFSTYFYYLYFKPEVIYKYLPLKSYDDIPYILLLIFNLQKVGLDQVRIFQILKDASPRKGWVRLFEALEKEATVGRFIFNVFEKWNFPKDVTLVLKSAELSKTFWDNMPILVEYVQDTNKQKHKLILTVFGGLSSIAGFLIILYFVSGLFLAMFSLQSLAISLM